MLISLFESGFSGQVFMQIIYFIIIWCITLTIHECAHGYVAYRMGDPTAGNMGRLTLNPVKHIDPIGLLMILIIGFGWAKPVPVNPRYFRNPQKGMAISAAAGPVSNLLMAILGVIIYRIIIVVIIKGGLFDSSFAYNAYNFFGLFAMLNVWFAVFNLIPVPPLDGSRIVTYFLPPKLGYYYNYVERYGFLILIILLNLGRINRNLNFIWILEVIAGWILSGINFVFNPIFALFGG